MSLRVIQGLTTRYLPETALASVHYFLSVDLAILHKPVQLLIRDIVELDREFLFMRVPAESEPTQAQYHMRYWFLSELLFSHFRTNHLLHRVTIMVDPEAAIFAQGQLNVDEFVVVGETNMNFTGKKDAQVILSHHTMRAGETYILSAGVSSSLTLPSVTDL